MGQPAVLVLSTRMVRVTVLIALLIFTGVPAPAQLTPSASSKAKQLVVMIKADLGEAERLGAGIVFARNNNSLFVVTAFHVVHPRNEPARHILVALQSAPDRWTEATLIHGDMERDAAVLTVSARAAPSEALQFDFLAADDLQRLAGPYVVYAMGQPEGKPWTTTEPVYITALSATDIEFPAQYLATGYSGGALLDGNGNLLGMVLSAGEAFGKARRSDELVRWLTSLRYPLAWKSHIPPVPADESAAQSPRTVRYYRTYLETIAGDRRYIGEVDQAAPGQIYSVTSDDKGRVITVASLRDGRLSSELRYHYEGGSVRPSVIDVLSSGRVSAITRLTRNAQGYRMREDFLASDGSGLSYNIYRYGSKEVEIVHYSAGEDRPYKRAREFSPEGVMKIERRYTADGRGYYEDTYDPGSGLRLIDAKIFDASILYIHRPSYDANGDIVREDYYTSANVWFGFNAYANGLLALKRYKTPTGYTKESVISYDISRRAREAKFSVNGTLICTLRADISSSGKFLRTMAVSPSGDLWAEYPNVWVNEIERDGRALDGIRTVLHRQGDWW